MFEGEQPGQGMSLRGTFGLRLKVRSHPNPWHPLQRPGRERHDLLSRTIFSEGHLGMGWTEEVRQRTAHVELLQVSAFSNITCKDVCSHELS